MSRRPDFLVIGAMKCGTSTLHDQLAAQPGIFMSDPKEPNFFSDDDRWAQGWDWYESLFVGGESAALRGESSTHYTKRPTHPHTVDRIRAHLSRARFVYLMRDPIERLVSQFIHEWTERTMSGSLDEAIGQHPHLLEYSRYAMQIRPYLEAFGSARVLPVFLERLQRQPQTELERIAGFLGFPGEVHWRTDLARRNASRGRLRRSPWRDHLTNVRPLVHIRRALVPAPVRERIKDFWRMTERPTLSAGTRVRVEEALDRDLAELSSWLGVELRCANFSESVQDLVPRWTDGAPGGGAR